MPNIIKILNDKTFNDKLTNLLKRAIQSGNLNLLLGSGASMPALQVGGNIEKEIHQYFEDNKVEEAIRLIYSFLCELQIPTISLTSNVPTLPIPGESAAKLQARVANYTQSITQYAELLQIIEKLLNLRKTNILPKQANIFTTNYDLFLEKASEDFVNIKLNDGFTRTPNLIGTNIFSSRNFFNSLFNNGNLYGYKVEIPTINLIKIHGSLSWKKNNNQIEFDVSTVQLPSDDTDLKQLEAFNNNFAVILPQKGKFRETIMDRTFYELLRLYANELDKENTLLITFGFSFEDEHIFDITSRALKNPTLKLIIFAYDIAAGNSFEKKFKGYNNVDIVVPEDGAQINFNQFNLLLNSLILNEA